MKEATRGSGETGVTISSVAPDTDAELVAQALAGRRLAYTLLYERHAPVVGRRLRRILRSPEDVKDVLQTTFIDAFRILHRYEPGRPFGAWLHGIAFRVTGRYLKARRRKWWLNIGLGARAESHPATDNPEQQAVERQLLQRAYVVLDQLPAPKRIAYALFELEGLGLAEIGEMVGASPQAVWVRVQSARKILQRRLGMIAADGRRPQRGGS